MYLSTQLKRWQIGEEGDSVELVSDHKLRPTPKRQRDCFRSKDYAILKRSERSEYTIKEFDGENCNDA